MFAGEQCCQGDGVIGMVVKGNMKHRIQCLGLEVIDEELTETQRELRAIAIAQYEKGPNRYVCCQSQTVQGQLIPERPAWAKGAFVYCNPGDFKKLEKLALSCPHEKDGEKTWKSKHVIVSIEFLPLLKKIIPSEIILKDMGPHQRFAVRRTAIQEVFFIEFGQSKLMLKQEAFENCDDGVDVGDLEDMMAPLSVQENSDAWANTMVAVCEKPINNKWLEWKSEKGCEGPYCTLCGRMVYSLLHFAEPRCKQRRRVKATKASPLLDKIMETADIAYSRAINKINGHFGFEGSDELPKNTILDGGTQENGSPFAGIPLGCKPWFGENQWLGPSIDSWSMRCRQAKRIRLLQKLARKWAGLEIDTENFTDHWDRLTEDHCWYWNGQYYGSLNYDWASEWDEPILWTTSRLGINQYSPYALAR